MRIDTSSWGPAQKRLWQGLSAQKQVEIASQGGQRALAWVNQQLESSAMHLRGTVGAGQITGRSDKLRSPSTSVPQGDPGLRSGLQELLQQAQLGGVLGSQPEAGGPALEKRWQPGPVGLQHYRDAGVAVGPDGLQAAGHAGYQFGPALTASGGFRDDLLQLGFAGRAGLESQGDVRGSMALNSKGLQASVDAAASAGLHATAAGQMQTEFLQAQAAAKANAQVFVQGRGDLAVNGKGAALDMSGKIGATAGVEAQAQVKTEGVQVGGGEELNLNGQVRGRAEVTAQAKGDVVAAATIEPPRAVVDIGGKAFAGAKAEVKGSVGLGEFVRLKGHAGAWAGAGAEGSITFGFDDGKLRFGIKGGTSWGYGAGAGGEIEIDVKRIANAALHTGLEVLSRGFQYALDPGAALKDAAKLLQDAPQKLGEAVEKLAKTGESFIDAAVQGLGSLAKALA